MYWYVFHCQRVMEVDHSDLDCIENYGPFDNEGAAQTCASLLNGPDTYGPDWIAIVGMVP